MKSLKGWGFSAGLTTLPSKTSFVQDPNTKPRDRLFGKKTGNWKSDLFCGTWNLQTLFKQGAAEKYKIRCIALQEDFRGINPRISTLTLRTRDFRIVLINAHAPTEEKDNEEKEEFYSTLEDNGYSSCRKRTMFPRKEIPKYTLVSPDGKYKNQIDHVLVNGRFRNGITNVPTLRGADSDSDHLLVGFWVHI
ncbi:Endonuclease/exonuclease/phosphatase [Cinara cedri]|uniref:Endonuclease/exonuclease/phosphatase n=1 Tax=Cinara cedri TaxID=506608 RepID=A0A5E4N2S8_9HEMI|nr:Endonuclease/exonuclease/phosphatase [Cinara cedri]